LLKKGDFAGIILWVGRFPPLVMGSNPRDPTTRNTEQLF
jgi:hypothetical protein